MFFNLLNTQTFIKTPPVPVYEAKLTDLLRWWGTVLLNVVCFALSILWLKREMSPYRLMCLNPWSLAHCPIMESLEV